MSWQLWARHRRVASVMCVCAKTTTDRLGILRMKLTIASSLRSGQPDKKKCCIVWSACVWILGLWLEEPLRNPLQPGKTMYGVC